MKKPLLLLILVLFTTISYSQTEKEKADHYLKERGELAFTFVANNLEEARELSLLVSFDHGQDRSNPLVINAIANQKNFEKFLAFNLPYTVDKKLNEIPTLHISNILLIMSRVNCFQSSFFMSPGKLNVPDNTTISYLSLTSSTITSLI